MRCSIMKAAYKWLVYTEQPSTAFNEWRFRGLKADSHLPTRIVAHDRGGRNVICVREGWPRQTFFPTLFSLSSFFFFYKSLFNYSRAKGLLSSFISLFLFTVAVSCWGGKVIPCNLPFFLLYGRRIEDHDEFVTRVQ